MIAGDDSTKNTFKTRQSSLRFHRLRTAEPVPKFFETELASPSGSFVLPSQHRPKPYNFAMNITALFGFFLTITFVGVLLFSSGFMVAYTLYAREGREIAVHSQPMTQQAPTVEQKPPLILAQGQSQAQNHLQIPSPDLKKFPASLAELQNEETKPYVVPQAEKTGPATVNGGTQEAQPPLPTQNPRGALIDQQTSFSNVPSAPHAHSQGGIADAHNAPIIEGTQEPPETETKVNPVETITAGYLQPLFAIEFGRSDMQQTADEMADEMTQQGLKAEVSKGMDEEGRTSYHVRSPLYKGYEAAYRSLIRMPKPFSLWGRIVRVEAKESPDGKIKP